MSRKIPERLRRIERVIAALHHEPEDLPYRITHRMLDVAGLSPERGYKLRLGHLKRLPESYRGERHVIITKHLPEQDGHEWVEFQEVPGPAPKTKAQVSSDQVKYLTVRFIDARWPGVDDEPPRDEPTPEYKEQIHDNSSFDTNRELAD